MWFKKVRHRNCSLWGQWMIMYADHCYPHRQRGLSYNSSAKIKMYFLVLTTAWHSSNWNVTCFLIIILSAMASLVSSGPSCKPLPSHGKSSLVFSFNDGSYLWQTNHTWPSLKNDVLEWDAAWFKKSLLGNQKMNWCFFSLFGILLQVTTAEHLHWVAGL